MSSAICFNWDQSKILSYGNGLKQTNFNILAKWYLSPIKDESKISWSGKVLVLIL